jgi:dTDP-4-dehydrorhamnose 3,5-epimerase
MLINGLEIPGTYLIANDVHTDNRGTFENIFKEKDFKDLGLEFSIKQVNLSRNKQKGTVRGLHFQRQPSSEDKVVNCIAGKIFDVMVDLRTDSHFFGCWQSVILEPTKNAVVIPKGVAHGFQTLAEDCVVQYLHSNEYVADLNVGLKFNDPSINILWPKSISVISDRDRNLPTLEELRTYL